MKNVRFVTRCETSALDRSRGMVLTQKKLRLPTSLSLSSVPRKERKEVGRGERRERERRGQGELDLDDRIQPPNCLFGPTCPLPPAYRPPCHFPAFLYEIFYFLFLITLITDAPVQKTGIGMAVTPFSVNFTRNKLYL